MMPNRAELIKKLEFEAKRFSAMSTLDKSFKASAVFIRQAIIALKNEESRLKLGHGKS